MSWKGYDSRESSYVSEPESSQSSPPISPSPSSSKRSKFQKPSSKEKPLELRSKKLNDNLDQDFLNDNLLDDFENGTETSSPSSRRVSSPRLSIQRGSSKDIRSKDIGSKDIGATRLVIAIDYGTTFTGVAYATPKSDTASLEDVEIVSDWGPGMANHPKIPSIYSYSPTSLANEQQWGASLSPDAVAMMNTKMELDVHDNKLDELELILQVLEGTSNLNFDNVKKAKGLPDYTWKDPEDIVTDYLSKIFQYLSQAVAYLGGHLRANLPVDIVITVPVKWSYAAKNSTFRAVQKAGFNKGNFSNLEDVMILTEPEAAAIYTARYLKEDKKKEFLKKGDCFTLCDAGGGTVDVVSYKVTQLEPLELEEMTIATSAKCGSAYIDANFKRWLHDLIGDKNYKVLDPRNIGQQIGVHTSEGKQMRQLMKEFDPHKKAFSNYVRDEMLVDLPAPLDKLNMAGKIKEGELKISHEDMKYKIFDPCVDKVVELIQGQINQVELKRFRVKNVFLVGGFGESPYLQEELKKSLDLRRVTMRRPDTRNSWTAVVRGAAIYGIEKLHHNNAVKTMACGTYYAVVLDDPFQSHKNNPKDFVVDPLTNTPIAQKQLTYIVRRGDLILSDEKKEIEREVCFRFRENDERVFQFPIYEYADDDEDMPDRFHTGENELKKVAVLDFDLSNSSLNKFERRETPKTKEPYYVVYLIFKLLLCGTSVEAELHWNKKLVCSVPVKELQTTSE